MKIGNIVLTSVNNAVVHVDIVGVWTLFFGLSSDCLCCGHCRNFGHCSHHGHRGNHECAVIVVDHNSQPMVFTSDIPGPVV